MSIYWLVGIVGVLTIISTIAGMWLVLVARACNKRRLLTETHGLICDMSGGAGISILCGEVRSIAWIERMLSDEYSYYEVIVVLDACEKPVWFEELQQRYHLFRGGAIPISEVPTSGIRALYRSRNRCYRRLVLVDAPQCGVAMAWNAALTVASYDYLLPLFGREMLLSGSLLRLAMEAGEMGREKKRLVRSRVGVPIILVSRDAVVEVGGFETHWIRRIPRHCRITLWEPMTCSSGEKPTRSAVLILITLTAVGMVIAAIATELWWLAAIGVTLLWIRVVIAYAKAMIVETIGIERR